MVLGDDAEPVLGAAVFPATCLAVALVVVGLALVVVPRVACSAADFDALAFGTATGLDAASLALETGSVFFDFGAGVFLVDLSAALEDFVFFTANCSYSMRTEPSGLTDIDFMNEPGEGAGASAFLLVPRVEAGASAALLS